MVGQMSNRDVGADLVFMRNPNALYCNLHQYQIGLFNLPFCN